MLQSMEGKRPNPLISNRKLGWQLGVVLKRHRLFGAITGALLSALGCVWYIATVVKTPRRTPLLIISAVYSPDWELNPWAAENRQLLGQLDGHNLTVLQAGDGTLISNGLWSQFDELIEQAVAQDKETPLLCYVNLHGVVNDHGEPCWVAPKSPVDDSRTWLPIWDVLTHLDQELGPGHALTLMIESSRVSDSAPAAAGSLQFSQALRSMLEDRCRQLTFSQLNVLVSSESGGTPSDWHGHCDPFTRELARGLHGAADRESSSGNADDFVDFHELAEFVRSQVQQWSLTHRGTDQSVWSWSYGNSAPRLAWTLSRPFRQFESQLLPTSQDRAEVVEIWTRIGDLHAQNPWHRFPGRWNELCRYMLTFESAVFGGSAAREQAPALRTATLRRLDWLEQELQPGKRVVPIEALLARSQAGVWNEFSRSPTWDTLQSLIANRSSATGELPSCPPVLAVLSQDRTNACWTQEIILARYAKLRAEVALKQAANLELKSTLIQSKWNDLLAIQTKIDDGLITASDWGSCEAMLSEYEAASQHWSDVQRQTLAHTTGRDKLLSQLPALASLLLSSHSASSMEIPATSQLSGADSLQLQSQMDVPHGTTSVDPVGQSLEEHLALEDRIVLLALRAARTMDVLCNGDSEQDLRGLTELDSAYAELVSLQSQLWLDTTRAGNQVNSAHQRQLEQLTCSTWFPGEFVTSAGMGELRVKARQRLYDWESELDFSAQQATQLMDLAHESNVTGNEGGGSVASDADVLCFLAACLTRRSSQQGLDAADYRALLRSARTYTGEPKATPEAESRERRIEHVRQSCNSRLAAGIFGTLANDEIVAGEYEQAAQLRLFEFASETTHEFWALPTWNDRPYFAWVTTAALQEATDIDGLREIHSNAISSADRAAKSIKLVSVDKKEQIPIPRGANPGTNRRPAEYHAPSGPLETIQETVRQLELAAHNAFKTSTVWLPKFNGSVVDQVTNHPIDEQWISQVGVVPTDEFVYLPAGTATVSIRDGESIVRSPVAIDHEFVGTTVELAVDWINSRSPELADTGEVSVNFRGHHFPSELDMRPYGGCITSVRFSTDETASLNIHDSATGHRRRTFILDCSASMFEPADVEERRDVEGSENDTAVASRSSALTKLDAAKLALVSILRALRDQGDEVCIILYGHRVSQGTAEQGTLLQTRYHAAFPFPHTIKAFEDVETILPMGRFGNRECMQVEQRLAAVLPWGQTPLFLSLMQAMDLGDSKSDLTPHDIVVISDGKNYQFNPTEDKRATETEVIAQAQAAHATIHVIGFGVPADEASETNDQFRQLAEATGGTATMQIADASLLTRRLTELNSAAEYRVRLLDGTTQVGRVNQPLSLPSPSVANSPIAVVFSDKTFFVPLNAGAAYQFHVNSLRNLVAIPYTAGRPKFGRLATANDQLTSLEVGVHEPKWQNGDVEWTVSWQSSAGEVAERPHYVLLEITPLNSDEERNSGKGVNPPSYLMVDASWAAGYSVPVLRFKSESWPASCRRARVSAWSGGAEAGDKGITYITALAASGVENWQPEAGVEVQCRSSSESIDMIVSTRPPHRAREWIPNLPGVEIRQISRRFNDEHNVAYHRFELETSSESPSNSSAASRTELPVELWSPSRLKESLLRLAQPIEVELTQPSQLLLPTP
jgi:hypothetical protein